MGATRPNVTTLEQHAKDEEVLRDAGDYTAGRRTAWTRFFVPSLETLVVPGRCGILAIEDFEVDLDGELELSAGATLEILR
jgi:hypothetical protein